MASRNLLTRALHMVGVGRITAVDDTGVIQKLQVTERPGPDGGPTISDKIESVSLFGFTSNPPLQSEVVLLRLWGNRTLTIAIGSNNQGARLKNLGPGDSALYNQSGAHIWLKPAVVEIDAGGQNVVIQNAANVTINATTLVRIVAPKIECTGDVIANCDSSAVSLATHVHGVTGGPETTVPLPA